MIDTELIDACSRARGLAHRADFAEWSKDHRGHSAIVNHVTAWSQFSNEFCRLAEQLSARNLPIPDCDCPHGSHEQPEVTCSSA